MGRRLKAVNTLGWRLNKKNHKKKHLKDGKEAR